MKVNVPDYNTSVEFPDTMSKEEIQGVLQKSFPSKKNVLETIDGYFEEVINQGIVKPVKRTLELYNKERTEALESMKKSVTEPSITSPLRALGGAIQYLWSPIEAVTESFGGIPATEVAEKVGVRPNIAKGIGNFVKYGIQMAPVGQLAKSKVIADIPALQMEEKMRKLGVTSQMTKKSLEEASKEGFPKVLGADVLKQPVKEHLKEVLKYPVSEKTISSTYLGKGLGKQHFEPRLTISTVEDITKASVEALKGNYDDSQRIFKNIGRLLANNEIDARSVPEILTKFKLSPEDFAKEFVNTGSYFGKGLNRFSQAAKELKKAFKDNPQAMRAFDDIMTPEMLDAYEQWTSKGIRAFQTMENSRRGMLVTQMATMMRNAWSQVGRVAIGTVDDVLQGAIRGTFGGEGKVLENMRQGLTAHHAFWSRLTPNGRNRLSTILEANHAVIEKTRLLSQPVHEVTLTSKVAHVLNIGNRTQEIFFRKLAFEAKLRQLLSKRGFSYGTIDPKHIPIDDIAKAVDYGLEMTFAASPKGTTFKNFIRYWSNTPLSTLNPFPRFGLYNAPKFLFDHSPLGYLHAFSPSTIKQLASGNAEVFAKEASRATLGTMMFWSAWQLRNSEYAGEKWYEVNALGKTWDTRAFAPLTTYLFLAEAMKSPERIKPQDWAMAAIGLNRIAGTGLVLTDWLRAKDLESAKKSLQTFVGQYVGSFTVPLRTAKDIYAHFSEEEARMRDIRDYPIKGPFLNNIPIISQQLPKSISPVKTSPMKVDSPLLRQATGFSGRTKTPVEKEIDKLNMDYRQVLPSTGIPKADRIIAGNMAPMVERWLPILLNNDKYKKASLPLKRVLLAEALKEIRGIAKKKLLLQNSNLYLQIYMEGMSRDIKQIIKERRQ